MENEKEQSAFRCWFENFANQITKISGSPAAFIGAFAVILLWAVSGPVFHYSETWQLVINTGTTIITFLMVFVIQQSANKDTMALHLKLNELIASSQNASNRLIGSEGLTGEELETLKKFYGILSERAKTEKDLFASHSVEEAEENSEEKSSERKKQEKKQTTRSKA